MKAGIARMCLAGWLITVSFCFAEDPVTFQDANLKSVVEAKLGITNPTPADMLALTYLNANSKSIHYLTGLEYALNLTNLYLDSNYITSLSPLAGLTGMKYLSLNSNSISSIESLAGMTQLISLNLRTNNLTTLAPLSGALSLQALYASSNHITDISALSGLNAIKNVSLADNSLSDIRPLKNMTLLNRLYLNGNPLNHYAYCDVLPRIELNNPGLIEFAYDADTNPFTEDCTTNSEELTDWFLEWLGEGCDSADNWCAGSDLNHDGLVNLLDFSEFLLYWLSDDMVE